MLFDYRACIEQFLRLLLVHKLKKKLMNLSLRSNFHCSKTSFFGGTPPLPEAAGWLLCVFAGLAFSLITTVLVHLDYKYAGSKFNSEQFNTAGRNVKTGLTASVIVSQWTWCVIYNIINIFTLSRSLPSHCLYFCSTHFYHTFVCLNFCDYHRYLRAATLLQSSNVAWQYGVSGNVRT